MSKTNDEPLQPNTVYHIIAHAVENNNLFYNDGNYAFFLNKWQHFTHAHFKTFAFCLMPNHIHFCIQTVSAETARELLKNKKAAKNKKAELVELELDASLQLASSLSLDITSELNIDYVFSRQMNSLLSSYVQSLNKQRKRKGTLLWGRFERLKVTDRDYLRDAICYIHHNPIHHFGAEDYGSWGFSSYNLFSQPDEGLFLDKKTVFKVFDEKGGFYAYHKEYKEKKRFLLMDEAVQIAINKLKQQGS